MATEIAKRRFDRHPAVCDLLFNDTGPFLASLILFHI
jgi:hypothetical protein